MFRSHELPKVHKGAWFVRLRGSYLPVTWQGALTYVPFVAYLSYSMTQVSPADHSILDGLMTIFPQWVAAAVVMTWIANRKS